MFTKCYWSKLQLNYKLLYTGDPNKKCSSVTQIHKYSSYYLLVYYICRTYNQQEKQTYFRVKKMLSRWRIKKPKQIKNVQHR